MRKGWRYVIAVIALLQPEERLKVMVDMRRFCKHCGRVGAENGEGVFWCKYDCSSYPRDIPKRRRPRKLDWWGRGKEWRWKQPRSPCPTS